MTSHALNRILHDEDIVYLDYYENNHLHYRLYNRVANEIYRVVISVINASGCFAHEEKGVKMKPYILRADKIGWFKPLID